MDLDLMDPRLGLDRRALAGRALSSQHLLLILAALSIQALFRAGAATLGIWRSAFARDAAVSAVVLFAPHLHVHESLPLPVGMQSTDRDFDPPTAAYSFEALAATHRRWSTESISIPHP
jgi:hypothetical protein